MQLQLNIFLKKMQAQTGERLSQFMRQRGITAYRLAKDLGVSPQGVSSMLSGSDIKSSSLIKMLETYPDLNIKWLLTGKGEMLEKSAAMEVSVSG